MILIDQPIRDRDDHAAQGLGWSCSKKSTCQLCLFFLKLSGWQANRPNPGFGRSCHWKDWDDQIRDFDDRVAERIGMIMPNRGLGWSCRTGIVMIGCLQPGAAISGDGAGIPAEMATVVAIMPVMPIRNGDDHADPGLERSCVSRIETATQTWKFPPKMGEMLTSIFFNVESFIPIQDWDDDAILGLERSCLSNNSMTILPKGKPV